MRPGLFAILFTVLVGGSAVPAAQDEPVSSCGGEIAETMCGPEPLTQGDRAALETRANSGDVDAMLALASDAGGREARHWYAMAAERGNCHAVRMLRDPMLSEGTTPSESARWLEADRRLGCSVERWRTVPDGGVVYALPDESLWEMRIDCDNGALHVSGPAGSNPSGTRQMIYVTSRGAQSRATENLQHPYTARAYRAEPDDEVIAALLRGERIRVSFFRNHDGWPIDGREAPAPLRSLLARCGS